MGVKSRRGMAAALREGIRPAGCLPFDTRVDPDGERPGIRPRAIDLKREDAHPSDGDAAERRFPRLPDRARLPKQFPVAEHPKGQWRGTGLRGGGARTA